MKSELLKRILSSIILIPLALYFIIKGSFFLIFFLSILFLASSYEWHQMSKKKIYFMPGIIFLLLSFISAYLLRNIYGADFFLMLIIICVFTDLGGYIFGKLFKGPKLTKISPNKTYAGMFGGFLLSVIAFTFFIENLEIFGFVNEFKDYQMKMNDLRNVLIVSLISQLGDLIISYFKRKSKVKNTGNFLPGHGGILDRIDGIIFVVPTIYLVLILIK
ncbi:MAG: hypothetical protein CBD61_00915 [Pelagibacteraceae bacterium TMED201]|nr:MAG: hypothetical protein CBD61_00915 [Pelagibacteraceae bacterium TMED201]|tara:strand:- start:82 stop:735 length:654 start_codon:yes stop_codon:yes gene_type:complete